MPKKDFFHRVNERFDDFDSGSRQAFLLRLVRDRGFFEAVFNAVEEGILVIDPQLRIRYFNRAASELLALPQDLTNLRVNQLLQDVDWRRILRSDRQAWDKVTRQELEILYPEPRFVQFYLVPLEDDTELAAVILRDVTENRRRQLSEVESETVKAVSLLAAGVAHEIGNPLNSLYLNLQIIERELAEEGGSEEQEEGDDEDREKLHEAGEDSDRDVPERPRGIPQLARKLIRLLVTDKRFDRNPVYAGPRDNVIKE
jgi:nitrogen fixation/metabolism regulation signal transduction histidine kinase